MNKLAQRIAAYFVRKGIIPQNEEDAFAYGADLILYTILSTLALLAIGLACGMLWQSAVLVGVFYTTQTLGGGFHARTHLGCLLTMAVCQGLGLAALHFLSAVLPPWAWLVLALLSLLPLMLFPVVLHKHKQYNLRKLPVYKRREQIANALFALLALLAFFLKWQPFATALATALLFCAVSRLSAKIRSKQR